MSVLEIVGIVAVCAMVVGLWIALMVMIWPSNHPRLRKPQRERPATWHSSRTVYTSASMDPAKADEILQKAEQVMDEAADNLTGLVNEMFKHTKPKEKR